MHDLSVRCWGAGGALGLGDTITRGDHPGEMGANLPPVDLGGPAELLYTRNGGACVRLVGGALKCWGLNNVGQLGLGDVDRRGDEPGEMGDALPPVELGAGRTALEVAGRSLSTCARLDDGTVKCWGYNSSGQLGQGDTEHRGDHPGEMGDALPPIALF